MPRSPRFIPSIRSSARRKLTHAYAGHTTFRRNFLALPRRTPTDQLAGRIQQAAAGACASTLLCRGGVQLPSPFTRATTASPQQQPQQRSRRGHSPHPHPPHHRPLHHHRTRTKRGVAAQDQTGVAVRSFHQPGRHNCSPVSAPSEEHRFRFRVALAPTCDSLSRRRPQPLSSCFALAPGRVRECPSDW